MLQQGHQPVKCKRTSNKAIKNLLGNQHREYTQGDAGNCPHWEAATGHHSPPPACCDPLLLLFSPRNKSFICIMADGCSSCWRRLPLTPRYSPSPRRGMQKSGWQQPALPKCDPKDHQLHPSSPPLCRCMETGPPLRRCSQTYPGEPEPGCT